MSERHDKRTEESFTFDGVKYQRREDVIAAL
jgi:hypothetical protein